VLLHPVACLVFLSVTVTRSEQSFLLFCLIAALAGDQARENANRNSTNSKRKLASFLCSFFCSVSVFFFLMNPPTHVVGVYIYISFEQKAPTTCVTASQRTSLSFCFLSFLIFFSSLRRPTLSLSQLTTINQQQQQKNPVTIITASTVRVCVESSNKQQQQQRQRVRLRKMRPWLQKKKGKYTLIKFEI
jgi:hypothetical protein